MRESLARLAEQARQQLAPELDRAAKAGEALAAERRSLEQALVEHRERARRSSEEQLRALTAELAAISAQVRQEFVEATRAEAARWKTDLDEKGTEVTHTTFEALYKAAEWYQKKAHTSMQGALDRLIEEASARLREQAGEVSRLFAAELDHRSRSFAEHTQGMLEEAAKELAARTLEQLDEFRDTRVASFDDEAHKLAERTLVKLNEAAAQAAAELAGRIEARVAEARAATGQHAERAVEEFQRRMQERLDAGLAAAREHMDASLKATLEIWQAERDTQQQEWRESQARETAGALEQLRQRLELASNAWLAASVTTLHATAQQGMAELSRATEEKVRETFAQALAGLGETLRQRILSLSAEIAPPKDTSAP
jgi:hypothetical protein